MGPGEGVRLGQSRGPAEGARPRKVKPEGAWPEGREVPPEAVRPGERVGSAKRARPKKVEPEGAWPGWREGLAEGARTEIGFA